MLFIVFQIGAGRYAIDAQRVVEMLPFSKVRAIPQAAPEISGVSSYRGAPLPILDLSRILLGQPAAKRLSTRILVVNLADGKQVGLIAERANETLRRNAEDFAPTGVAGAACLGPVTEDARGFVQWIEPDQLVSGVIYRSIPEEAVS